MTYPPVLLLLLASALLAPAAHAAVTLPCATITGITGCTECLAGTGAAKGTCYFCAYNRIAVYTADKVSSCKAASTSCAATPGGANCRFCNAGSCLRCKEGFIPNASGLCVAITSLKAAALATQCKAYSLNAKCAECNPDGTCKRCPATPATLVTPANSIWLDAGYPETSCTAKAAINVDANDIVGTAAYIPANCHEIDTDFACSACKAGFGPKAGAKGITCVANPSATKTVGGCLKALPYMQYCKKCTVDGKKCASAAECTGSRGLDASGYCSLNCKGFWGIGCKTCTTAGGCTSIDPLWANGR